MIYKRKGGLLRHNDVPLSLKNIHIITSKQNTITPASCSSEDMFAFDTQSLLRNVPYKMFHTKEVTALPRRWKKMSTAIGLSVCKIHIIFFCDGATKMCDGVTVY